MAADNQPGSAHGHPHSHDDGPGTSHASHPPAGPPSHSQDAGLAGDHDLRVRERASGPRSAGHTHDHEASLLGRLLDLIPYLHGHSHGSSSFEETRDGTGKGIWAVKVSLLLLGLTALFQLAIVLASGSVALLADTIHNFTDALTALPLWLA